MRPLDSVSFLYWIGMTLSGKGFPVFACLAAIGCTRGRGPGPLSIQTLRGASMSPKGCPMVTITSSIGTTPVSRSSSHMR